MKFRSTLALACLLAATAGARAEPTAAGLWEAVDDSGKPEGWFLFTQKNDVYSARLVKGFRKEGEENKPIKTICDQCPEQEEGAHIMGLTLFWGMKRDGLNYTDGSVLDPRDGSVYHAKMWLDEDGQTLHVRGYLGISLLGKTQDWKRLPDDAMKKEDIPKEILAGDEEKAKHVAEKDKDKHKPKDKAKAKADKSEPAPAEAEAPAADATPAEKAQ